MRTRRCLAGGEPAVAHVAFADDSETFGKFRNVVRALQNAVAAADALIIEMQHDSGDRILFIGENRASV